MSHFSGSVCDSEREGVSRSMDSFLPGVYELGRLRATGFILARPSSGSFEEISVRDGAALGSATDALGRLMSTRLDDVASLRFATWSFCEEAVLGAGRPVSLARWARERIERELDLTLSSRIAQDLQGARITLENMRRLDASTLDSTDRDIIAALSLPRELGEVATLARVPRYRLLAFVHFASTMGALVVLRPGEARQPASRRLPREELRPIESPVSQPASSQSVSSRASALRSLGLPLNAENDSVKRAFKKLVRALHPDLQPGIGEARRKQLELRLAHVNAAYLELSSG